MNTLIIYDNTGYIISQGQGEPLPREPQGTPFIWAEIPTGQQLKITDGIGVDVSVTPNVAILEDIPKTELEIVKEQVLASQDMINALMMM